YRQRGLSSIARDAKLKVDFPANVSADDSSLYSRLRDLFFIIDAGDVRYDVPAYNGKLFSDNDHAFLQNNQVGDQHLAPAIYKLATIQIGRGRNAQRVPVDYQDLEVSHLGTIYEKLLEYQLAYTDVDLVTSGSNQTYKAARPNQTADKPAGSVYLRTGNNQRKVTGSYYTPDYIVRFIVEKTLQPLLSEITERYATLDANDQWQLRDPAALRDAILAVNVLDPATGSGHFAVDVVSYIAEWLVGLGLPLPESESNELAYWMRQVASSCIYAVDINPLAVELAKLSIWLKTLAKDKPLNFLDHHIRVGNSLVGASLADIEDLAGQPATSRKRRKKVSEKQAPLFGEEAFTVSVGSAVGQMTQIESVQANDVSDVKRQEQLYNELRERLRPYEQLAMIWTARDFGLEMPAGEWEAIYKLTLAGTPTPKI
ncbi:MAG: hypothetical protein KC496_17550, partial [Anaerolineae bacterium]|nr:hypothetical protein [Anaerolineae bacterium]